MAEALYYAAAAVFFCISGVWAYMVRTMLESFRKAPFLDSVRPAADRGPKVSIILPARNEEGFLEGCLCSLEGQDYHDYEIIAIDDSSTDATPRIIAAHAESSPRVVHVSARPKPDGWMGKNWACVEGYRRATGELLLFTDADTVHSKGMVSLAVSHLESQRLEALSVMPRLLAKDFWTRATLPLITTFMHTRFSPLNVNDPSKKTAYFFGSFFILRKKAYEGVGTHEGVRGEVIEDGALGRKFKESGRRMRMVRGEHLLEAVWARDRTTLWDALKRLMVPLYLQDRKTGVGIFCAVTSLLFAPFVALGAAALLFTAGPAGAPWAVFMASAALSSSLAVSGAAVEARSSLKVRAWYAILAPLGGAAIVAGFLAGIVGAARSPTVSWRGRRYVMRDGTQGGVKV